jgi:hypothetical protein
LLVWRTSPNRVGRPYPCAVKDNPEYAQLIREMTAATDDGLLADLTRFIESFGDHDDDCPGYSVYGREAELATCTCGFVRRHDLIDEVRRRLGRA